MNNYFDAEDLTQETFLAAYNNLSSFDRSYEKAWLCRIATNKCLDYCKHSGRKSIPTDEEYFLYQKDESPTPEEKTLNKIVKEELFVICNKLRSPYKEIALDYFYHELLPAEISDKNKKNIKTVQTQIYRARSMLKKLYKKEVD